MSQLKSFSNFKVDEENQAGINGGWFGRFKQFFKKVELNRHEGNTGFDKGRTYYATRETQRKTTI